MTPLTVSPDRLSLQADGQSWIWRGTLDWSFRGVQLNQGLDAARTIVRDRRSVGANIICVGGMLAWVPGLNPTNTAYWSSLRDCSLMVEDEGLRLCHVVLCDTASLLPDAEAAYAHFDRYVATLGDRPDLLVGMNQPGHPTQLRDLDPRRLEPKQIATFPKLLAARDNPLESANPTMPAGDFSCYCSNRDPIKGVIEVGSSLWYVVNGWPGREAEWGGTHGATVLFEGPHFKPSGEWSDPGAARQLARSLCFKGTIGGNFYSDQCAQSVPLTGPERNCAIEYLGNIPSP